MNEADRAFFENLMFDMFGYLPSRNQAESDEKIFRAALAHARGKQEPVAWLPMDSAPKDSTMVRLLVKPDAEAHTSFEDSADPYETIGFNQLEHTLFDAWEFAGWCWQHDVFATGSGTPIGWLPLSAPHAESAEVVRLREALNLAANRLHRIAIEEFPLKADAHDWHNEARVALSASPAPETKEQLAARLIAEVVAEEAAERAASTDGGAA